MRGLCLCALHRVLSKSRKINICENPRHVTCSCIINCVGCLEPAGKCVMAVFYPLSMSTLETFLLFISCASSLMIFHVFIYSRLTPNAKKKKKKNEPCCEIKPTSDVLRKHHEGIFTRTRQHELTHSWCPEVRGRGEVRPI